MTLNVPWLLIESIVEPSTGSESMPSLPAVNLKAWSRVCGDAGVALGVFVELGSWKLSTETIIVLSLKHVTLRMFPEN